MGILEGKTAIITGGGTGIGFGIARTFLAEVSAADWDNQMRVNTFAPWRMSVEVLPSMRKAGGGSIINISSISGLLFLSETRETTPPGQKRKAAGNSGGGPLFGVRRERLDYRSPAARGRRQAYDYEFQWEK